jgi:hypothetical protein
MLSRQDNEMMCRTGPIRDRSQEMLSSADVAITQLYRSLLACAKAARDGGDIPALSAEVGRAIGISGEIGPEENWRRLVPHHRIVSSARARSAVTN